ncbi:hypothetical protein CALCODRAFT_511752 [Calocera cornea HHB12733]|uniref:F-box domain-containing protein n=1 Tax=Calocera cornea HHB12733 TaxID=1353952 RepID=A0A165DJ82_9BASI|nr:hypothetical protein CALCODRAFT_511752 [Calocera cornea HHB12733]
MLSLDRLPDDILLLVLSALSVPDVLSVRVERQTCRYLYAVSYTPSVWLALHARLSRQLPLPSLPHPTLSSPNHSYSPQQETLERLLTSSLRLSRNWSSPRPVPTSCTLIKGARHVDKLEVVGEGGWLLALTDGVRLALYDLRSGDTEGSEDDEDDDDDDGTASSSDPSPNLEPAHERAKRTNARKPTFPRVFRQPKRVAEYTSSTGRGWHCGFESHLTGDELFVLLSWRNQTDLLRIPLTPPKSLLRSRRQQFTLLQSFERIRESAPTPCAISDRLLVYPSHSGLLRVVDYRTWEEGVLPTWNPSGGGGVAEGWSREDPLSLLLLPGHILVLKPTSLQLFPLPALHLSPPRLHSPHPSGTGAEGPRPGPVWHLPFRVDAAVFSQPREGEALSVLLRDVDNWTLVHYRLRPAPSPSPVLSSHVAEAPSTPAAAPYLLPPTLVAEISDLAFAQRDRHNTFSLGCSGSRGLVQGMNGVKSYTAPWLAAAERSLSLSLSHHHPSRSRAGSRRAHETAHAGQGEPTLRPVLHHTPLQVMEGGNGLSVDEASGVVAVGEGDGDVWVFGFGFGLEGA